MTPPLRFLREAEADLRDAYQWYQQQRPGLGEDFLSCLETGLAAIQENPGQFPVVHKDIRRALLRRFPYAVYFIFRQDMVTILAVFHCRRDPQTWAKRIPKK